MPKSTAKESRNTGTMAHKATDKMRTFVSYDEKATTNESNALYRRLALSHARTISHEATRNFLVACITGYDIRALCDFDPPYGELTPPDAYNTRQCQAFFSKRDDIDLGEDRDLNAAVSFKKAESLCRDTNNIFRLWSQGKFQFHPDVDAVLFRAQRKIVQILGDVPTLSDLKFRFGPGATTRRKKQDSSPRYKLGDEFVCSEAFVPIAGEFLSEFPQWAGLETDGPDCATLPVSVEPGVVSFVPKSWKTKRAIVVEPMLNTMFQLGIGDYIARRLKLAGVDIRDQTANQNAARYGSLTGALATLDLSSASDTISKELVAHLLPLDWYSFLCFGRSSVVELDGVPLRQEKFSSMGNGFTFPLETLIFYALSVSCYESSESKQVLAYGDDIIVPTSKVRLVMRVLNACGFVLNKDKSFWHGAFRESCGKDYLLGIDIRPYYARDKATCASLFELHNFYIRRADYERAALCLRFISSSVRIYGPDCYGDGHLLSREWNPKPHKKADSHGYGGYTFDTYRLGPRSTFKVSRGDYVYPTYTIYASANWDPMFDQETYRREDYWLQEERTPNSQYRKGRLGVTLPGTQGYKRISIYTFQSQ